MDFSTSSLKISKRRARIRRLRNIVFVRDWIEGVRFLGLGVFELFECSGVLHHLKIPILGLNVLKDSLLPHGGVSLMVYAKYGRIGVYQIQNLVKVLNGKDMDIGEEVKATNTTLHSLPETNWFVRDSYINDHIEMGAIGVYDLFLHKRDIAFSFESLFIWLREGGIHFTNFDNYKARFLLSPKYIVKDYSLYKAIHRQEAYIQWEIIAKIRSKYIKHEIYASKIHDSEANIQELSNVLYLNGNPINLAKAISDKRRIHSIGDTPHFLARVLLNLQPFSPSDSFVLNITWNQFNKFVINKVVHSSKHNTLRSVLLVYRQKAVSNISQNKILRMFKMLYDSIKDTEMFLLKQSHIASYPKTAKQSLFLVADMKRKSMR